MESPGEREDADVTAEPDAYAPNQLLSRLVGDRMYSIEFVLNDYVQLRFDGDPGAGSPVIFNSYVWPIVEQGGRTWRESDLGYADALRRLTPGVVTDTTARASVGIRLDLDTGALVIRPRVEEVRGEIAEVMGFYDRNWIVWQSGEVPFEELVGEEPGDFSTASG